ncbi:hypothetical protein RhiirA5_428137 [Rhizophagus irregularis]|uniref:Uncharacterized protein n=1 Tax=Rhizophagus irregularis TaxID=588596 RepID=A0A2N0P0W5_9GLOM|nr:hypothetical protein RhiirA5_428137 [Rhizophagus irregularis]PKC64167.1 hypothetical protein RhiirA1_462787 [Rhizophagus irregularis]
MTRRVKDKYLCGEKNLKEIHLKLFDEEEKIGYHMVANSDIVDLDNSPELVKCSGCEKNVSKKNNKEDENGFCLIYINNQKSRIIKKRVEKQFLKPYESLRNIIKKNEIIREYVEYDINDEFYNWRIDLIDKLIETTDENFIKFLKNSLIEEEKRV